MIDDEELCRQFKAESDEHLQRMERALLALEGEPGSGELLEALLREMHTLKGDARMLGLEALESLIHRGEDLLRPLQRGGGAVEAARFYPWLDALRALVREAVSGEPAGVEPETVMARLQGEAAAPPGAPGTVPPPPLEEPYRVDTVRVPTEVLDRLFAEVGELAVTRSRLQERVRELNGLVEVWDDWMIAHRRRAGDRFATELRTGTEGLRDVLAEDVDRLSLVTNRITDGVRTMRMVPLATLFDLFPRHLRDLAQEEGKSVRVVTAGGEIPVDKQVVERLKDALLHLLRNALHHGIEPPAERQAAGKQETGEIRLVAEPLEGSLRVTVGDDGRGLDETALKREAVALGVVSETDLPYLTAEQVHALALQPGLSTERYVTNISGRGLGLDVVRERVESLRGSLALASRPGLGLTVRMRVPLTLVSTEVLLASCLGHHYALPAESVLLSRAVIPADLPLVEGRPAIRFDGQPVPVVRLDRLLALGAPAAGYHTRAPDEAHACVVIESGQNRLGLLVDELLAEVEVIVKPTGALLRRVRGVSGSAILGSGEVCIVLNPYELIEGFERGGAPVEPPRAPVRRRRVLLVEDSLVTRTQERRILEQGGFEVTVAVDGEEALTALAQTEVDAVVADVLMPRLDGIALTRRIRRNPRTAELPVVLVTTLASDADRRRGLEAGANAYLTKSLFDPGVLLGTLHRLT